MGLRYNLSCRNSRKYFQEIDGKVDLFFYATIRKRKSDFTMSDVRVNPINENTVSITDKNDDPIIDSNGQCYDPIKDIYIYDCKMDEENHSYISGFTSDGVKARYIFSRHKWFYGKEIRETNLINLRERSKDERLKIIEKANESKRENIQKKKNFNELAKAMLEQVASDKTIRETVDDPAMMIDNTYGSLILAAMIQGAKNGSFKCAEFIRDTAGYKPKNEVDISADIMTDADRSLLDKIGKRIG